MRGDDGYALLEVLIALLMLTLIAGSAGGLLSRSMKETAAGPELLRGEIETRNEISRGSSGNQDL